MEGSQSDKINDLKVVFETLKKHKEAILNGNPPPEVVSREELIGKIKAIIGHDHPFKKMGDNRFGQFINLVTENLIGNDNVAALAVKYFLNVDKASEIKKFIISKITAVAPELAEIFAFLSRKKYAPGWARERSLAERKSSALSKKRQKVPEVCCTETLPAAPLIMDEKNIVQWFVPETEPESITAEMVEKSFLKHILGLESLLPFDDGKIKSFIYTIAVALLNPEKDIHPSQELFMFLTKIGRGGKKDIDQIAMTIRELLSSGR